MANLTTFDALQRGVHAFNKARAWRRFHAPKNLAMALAIEAAELMEPMRWLTPRESWAWARSPDGRKVLEAELADVFLLCVSLADYLGVDLLEAAAAKLARNAERYPEDRARGRADKYTAYEAEAPAVGKAQRGR